MLTVSKIFPTANIAIDIARCLCQVGVPLSEEFCTGCHYVLSRATEILSSLILKLRAFPGVIKTGFFSTFALYFADWSDAGSIRLNYMTPDGVYIKICIMSRIII